MNWRQWFVRKRLTVLLHEAAGEQQLRRILGPIALTSLGVGAIIGAGIFVMTGRAAAIDAGPSIMISYCIAGLGCLFAALCYAEFAAMAPVAGSAYTYAYATLGELFAWIIGWDLILEYAMACACVAASWSEYLNELLKICFDVEIPKYLLSDPFSTDGAWFNLPAVLIMLLCTSILVMGIRESATANAALVFVKVGVVLFVIVLGWRYVNTSNWTSIPPEQRIVGDAPASKWGVFGLLGVNQWLVPIDDQLRSPFMPYGLSGFMLGASIVFFAFIGFDSISTHSEEAKRPQRDVPIGILASLVVCTLLYLLVSAVITGMEPYPDIDQKAAIAAAFRKRAEVDQNPLLHASAGLIAVGALAGMTSVLLISFLSQARIFLAMSRDGLLPASIFAAIHPRFRTPHRSTILTGLLVSLVAGLTPITKLEEMVNIGTLMAFVIVCAAVWILRVRRPDAHRPFRSPMLHVVAPFGILVNLTLMLFLPLDTWLRLVVWLLAGLGIYFFYGMGRSRLGLQLRGPASFAPAAAVVQAEA
ncbi:MAG: amino acid permease [Gemmataceae bacterium]